ncbi:MAG: hypothetical protein H6Q90_1903 [Deltaproteobacteria bacterium]|nr:hypothetical protein [Deltaproteobacteria bacterium]
MRGFVLGILIAGLMLSCMRAPQAAMPDPRPQKMTEIIALWAQIRGFRREAHMDLDPNPTTELQWRTKTVSEAARVCADGHQVPKTCGEICSLADAICDNAEAICGLANELGKDDQAAQEKCTSAKASCREAKQRCCNCSKDTTAGEPSF